LICAAKISMQEIARNDIDASFGLYATHQSAKQLLPSKERASFQAGAMQKICPPQSCHYYAFQPQKQIYLTCFSQI
jgi:hypothetical protein